jgi:hypothetical protein
MKRIALIAAVAAFSFGAPVAAQASTGCAGYGLPTVHNLKEHGTTCSMARRLANISLNGPNGYHRWIYVGSRVWTVTVRPGAPCARPWAVYTMRSGSRWITFGVWPI